MDEKKFFDLIKLKLFDGKLTQSQVSGFNNLFACFEVSKIKDNRWIAYMLATVFHETAKTIQPIEEYGKGKNYPYGKKLKRSRVAYTTPDKLYYGRGFVQLTWFENYQTMGKLLNIDLLNHPELALDEKIASKVLIEGMTKGESSFGDFTGVSLENYFNDTKTDWINARKIINGLDKAELIASYAKVFYEAITP